MPVTDFKFISSYVLLKSERLFFLFPLFLLHLTEQSKHSDT